MPLTPRFAGLTPTGRLRGPVARVLAVRDGPNPSFDYYLAPRLGALPTRVAELADGPPSDQDWRGTLVVFCRYLSGAWMRALEKHGGGLAGVGLLLDDDIDALAGDPDIPAWYRLRLYRRHLRFRRRLQGRLDLLWVSNALIAEPHGVPYQVLAPIAGREDEPVPRDGGTGLRVAFHSTSVHEAEHRWLRPVLRQAIAAVPDVRFEVTAGWPLRRFWRALPRTTIFPPQPWPAFRTDTARMGADLLLAPLLPSRGNAARAWTKRIDAARLGAALLVSDAAVYCPEDEELRLGMCLPLEPAAWAARLVALAREPEQVRRLRDLNRAFVLQAARDALIGESGRGSALLAGSPAGD